MVPLSTESEYEREKVVELDQSFDVVVSIPTEAPIPMKPAVKPVETDRLVLVPIVMPAETSPLMGQPNGESSGQSNSELAFSCLPYIVLCPPSVAVQWQSSRFPTRSRSGARLGIVTSGTDSASSGSNRPLLLCPRRFAQLLLQQYL